MIFFHQMLSQHRLINNPTTFHRFVMTSYNVVNLYILLGLFLDFVFISLYLFIYTVTKKFYLHSYQKVDHWAFGDILEHKGQTLFRYVYMVRSYIGWYP